MVLNFQENISLLPYNTFGVSVKSKKFIGVENTEALIEVLNQNEKEKLLILGGGSNLLLTQDFEGLTIRMENRGMKVVQEDAQWATVKVAAGENWHEFVLWCLGKNLGGVENLALIPGSVGGAPIQNIGAYGVELKEVFESCEALSLNTKKIEIFTNKDCDFGYRNSIFKNRLKGQYIICSVTFKLSKSPHKLNTSYRGLSENLEGHDSSIQSIAQAVIEIRSAKLPDPKQIGNSGSFFKNPVIPSDQFKTLQNQYPEIPYYPDMEGNVKIPAAWFIDQLGWKGYRKMDAGVHKDQALVLVNYGNASGMEIKELAQAIQSEVSKAFGIVLDFEVNVL
ncbi:UDP-N-acetylmuramate dehydrogenase [Flavobacteriaceae bacterium]|jgi:UDP-N-acetylmuramate dehydrogenase|nr:UDP-N-acetylmuramate dehydrogenase [Flavobacteriaceae bacterium]